MCTFTTRATLLVAITSVVCGEMVIKERILCKDRPQNLNEFCSIACSTVLKPLLNVSHNKIQISCQSRQAWNDFSKVKTVLNTAETNHNELIFLDSVFSDDFNLRDFTKEIGLDKINSITIKGSKKKPFGPSKIFFQNSSFEQLEIIGLNMTVIPDNFLELPELKLLRIKYSSLDTLKENDFVALRNLKVLDLSLNEISIIKSGVFDSLVELYSLDLSSNKLVTLPDRIFKNLRELRKVYLNSNTLHRLPIDLFFIEDTSNGQDYPINNEAFENTTKLPDLSTDQNIFLEKSSVNHSKVEWSEADHGLVLNKTKENFSTSDEDFESTKNSFEVGLDSDKLLDDPFQRSKLREIYLNNNQLMNLPNGTFANLTKLQVVDLSQNNLFSLPADLFHETQSLTLLKLNKNSLMDLPPRIFKDANALEFLNLASNNLTRLRSEFLVGLSSLTTIDVSQNWLTQIDQDFCEHVPNVEEFSSAGNSLSSLGDSLEEYSIFRSCRKIRKLVLSSNKISKVYNDWISSDTLEKLSLARNRVTNVTLDVCALNVEVDLRNNEISVVNLNLGGLERIIASGFYEEYEVRINLGGNKWNCTCQNYDIVRYLKRETAPEVGKIVKIKLNKYETCSSPKATQQLTEIDLSDCKK